MDFMSQSDEALAVRARKGDEAAFEALVARYLSEVYGFSRHYAGTEEKAADIAQETFIKVWRHLKDFDPERKFRSWLFTIAKHTALDWLRKKEAIPFSFFESGKAGDYAFEVAEEQHDTIEDVIDRNTLAHEARLLLEQLPEHHRKIVSLHHDDELTFHEIATLLKEPLNTVKSRYRRAIIFLKKNFSEDASI